MAKKDKVAMLIECPKCDGTGREVTRRDEYGDAVCRIACRTCKGSGKIVVIGTPIKVMEID